MQQKMCKKVAIKEQNIHIFFFKVPSLCLYCHDHLSIEHISVYIAEGREKVTSSLFLWLKLKGMKDILTCLKL